jgi:hypothetical protein
MREKQFTLILRILEEHEVYESHVKLAAMHLHTEHVHYKNYHQAGAADANELYHEAKDGRGVDGYE